MKKLTFCIFFLCSLNQLTAQVTQRERHSSWNNLIAGARFIDRFEPMNSGKTRPGIWGTKDVQNRYADNGIEDPSYSYWGGNIIFDAQKREYNLFVCGWPERSPKGHFEWPNSTVYHAVSKKIQGPYTIRDTVGRGHNPEIYRTANGTYILYVIGKRYTSRSLNGPWTQDHFVFDSRQRPVIEGLSNLTFARREDGSFLMVCRGGGIWISKDGLSPYCQITGKRVYPNVAGEFEDPVVWRDNVQYHLIVNDWLGRIAFYQRSPDGINWVTDPGEAYTPDIARHADGAMEKWFKFERMKVFLDKYGRAAYANFAVIDTLKAEDKAGDNHSSKNIVIPLNPGLLMSLQNSSIADPLTGIYSIKIDAEEGFDPYRDLDINSLRFGASRLVNFGKGARVLKQRREGKSLILSFKAAECGIDLAEFAPKLLGKSKKGKMIFAYARAPWIQDRPAILSTLKPELQGSGKDSKVSVDVGNFGQSKSSAATLFLYKKVQGNLVLLSKVDVQPLNSFEHTKVQLPMANVNELQSGDFSIVISAAGNVENEFNFSLKPKTL